MLNITKTLTECLGIISAQSGTTDISEKYKWMALICQKNIEGFFGFLMAHPYGI